MQIVVISPESQDPREVPAMEGFFAAGLERYHVRKPQWSAPDLEAWLRALPVTWRARIVLHQHHSLVGALGLGGRHEKSDSQRAQGPSRSCHDLSSLRRYMKAFDQVIFGPIFPSISKASYEPPVDFPWAELKSILKARGAQGSARILAIGGVTAAGLERCAELGFDGAAVLGAVWTHAEPVRAYSEIVDAANKLGAERNAA
jgi:thiamine-phosphate pyrophosphorylase